MRTGHELIPDKSKVFQQIISTNEYATSNDMKLNFQKTDFMVFNRCEKIDFQPDFSLEGTAINTVAWKKLLGVIISEDLSFRSNTEFIVSKAYKRIWILKRLKKLGASTDQLLDVYIKQVRCILELAAPVWHSSLTSEENLLIERVQKNALRIIYGNNYENYQKALNMASLVTLEERRVSLCKKFAMKCVKHPKHSKWFVKAKYTRPARVKRNKFLPVRSRTAKFGKSPVAYLTQLLNDMN